MGYHIYGLGAALVDTEIEVTEEDLDRFQVEKGVMTLVGEDRQQQLIQLLEGHLVTASRASGGSGANSIIAAQYFGAQTFYSCKVADDDNGHFYLQDLDNAGVAYAPSSMTADGITGKCLVMITADAERTMNTFLGISESLGPQQIDEQALKASEFVYIEGYQVTSATGRQAAIELRQLAERHGVKTALSLSDPSIVEIFYDGMHEMVGEQVDLLFCNEAEALAFTRTGTIELAARDLQKFARTFAITRGAEGALIFDGTHLQSVVAPVVTAIDTNGAGDMFAGAFLYGLSQGYSYMDAASLANRAAARIVSQYGPRLRPEQHAELLAG